MNRIRMLFLSLLAVFAVSSVISATASAELQGPWWKQVKKGVQIKLELNKEQAVKGVNEGSFTLKSKLLGLKAVIKCETVLSEGNIWNGLHQGEDNAEVKFTKCVIIEPCKEEAIVEPSKTFTELMWKYRGETKELNEVGAQKIYDVFAPTAEPKEGKALFTIIKIPAGSCKGEFPVNAVGTPATFIDQNRVEHKIVWGTAALVEPQNEDAVAGHLNWIDPNVTKLHHQEKEIVAKLTLGPEPAELQGKVKVEENSAEPFGAFSE